MPRKERRAQARLINSKKGRSLVPSQRIRHWLMPMYTLVSQLAKGECHAVDGFPVMAYQGELVRMDYVIAGFIDMLNRAPTTTACPTSPLQKLQNKLEYGMMLTETDITSAWQCLAQCEALLRRLTLAQLIDLSTTTSIAIEVEAMGLTQADAPIEAPIEAANAAPAIN
jgi:hypothetical protein